MRNRRLHWHIRRALRQPIPFWIGAVVLTTLTVTTVTRVTGAAAAERDRWGERVPTVVALHDLEPGHVVRAGDTEGRLLPAALVPDGAAVDDVTGTVVAAFVGAGEVVLLRRLAPAGLSPTAALLPPGTRGVAVPQGPAPLPVELGDLVDVLATFDGQPTFAVAAGAVVVAVTEDAVTVAVDGSEVDQVAFAVTSAAVTLALAGVGSVIATSSTPPG